MGCTDSDTIAPTNTAGQPPHLGHRKSSLVDSNLINVATLNYCGIMYSPFEFYSEEYKKDLEMISDIFAKLLPQYLPNFNPKEFKWTMGKLDLKFKIGRYSSMFYLETGIEQGCFLSKQQFFQRWDQVYSEKMPTKDTKYSEQDKELLCLYDFIMFHTLLEFVYGEKPHGELVKQNPSIYLNKLKPLYSLSFLNQERKLTKTIEGLSKVEADVFFFQQYSPLLEQYFRNRRQHHIKCDNGKDTMIIAKKTTFPAMKDEELVLGKLTTEQRKNLDWSERSAFMVVDNYILINAHLSSKEQRNKEQIAQLKKGLADLKNTLPQYEIILGGDLNSFLGVNDLPSGFKMYPDELGQLTTVKKRTMTQAQFHKGNKIIQESKDKVISTLKIVDKRIMYISGVVPKHDNYVPTDEHPFDHFLLACSLEKPQ